MMQLDNQQQDAVTTTAKRALVLAGSGSGKTRVLIERIAYLIESIKVSPYEIMAFSFTRKASAEIRTRLTERIGHTASRAEMGTMHSIALRMIQRFGEQIGLKPYQITVYSAFEENYLLKEVATEIGFFKKTWAPLKKKDIDLMFADYYERGIMPGDNHKGRKLFDAFIFRMQENNALTYGALLAGLELLLPTLAKHLHFRYILVDETQDLDPLQWRIIESMCNLFGAKLFAVGDIDQSIYEFRGAVPKYLLEHQETFSIYRLETNYRSDAFVVDAANQLIKHNSDRLEKTMVAFEDHQSPVTVRTETDSAALVSFIAELEKAGPGVMRAVLCRVHGPLIKLSGLLTEAGIKNVYVGKKSALANTAEFRRFHAFLKLIVNPFDNFAFLLIRELLGIDRTDYSRLRQESSAAGRSHFQTFQSHMYGHDFATLCYNASLKHTVLNVKSIIDEINMRENRDEKFPTRFDPNPIVDFIFDSEKTEISDYLNWLATYDLQEEIKEGEDCRLHLMTIHAAKGLEWPTVIVAGCNEGMLPSHQAIKNDEIESERRLAYVAWTRAVDRLYLTVRPETSEDEFTGKVTIHPVSRFIAESEA